MPVMNGAVLTGELSADGSRIVLAATGNDWDLDMIAARLSMLTPLAEPLRDRSGNIIIGNVMTVPATWPAVAQLNRSFGNGIAWLPQPRLAGWMAAEAARRVMPPPPLPDDIAPAGLTARDYQRRHAAAIACHGKVLLLDDPGLGKTVTSLLGIEGRRRAGHQVFPMIITVPSWDVADVWDTHIRQWMPHWPAPVMHAGTGRTARLKDLRRAGQDYILVTTYATARRDAASAAGILVQARPAAVIADEAHLIGNDRAHQSQALQRLGRHAATIILASGTMIKHSMKNIFPALITLDHRSYPSWDRVKPRWMTTASGNGREEEITGLRRETEDEFFACLEGQILRNAKADVLDQLPPKIYSLRSPDMPAGWRHAYEGMARQMLAELPDGGELPVMTLLAQLTRLSQLASSAADVEVTWEKDADGLDTAHYEVTLKRPCWKADSVLEILAEREGMPVAVFTESRQLAMLTGQYCEEAGLRAGYIVGEGAGPGYRITKRTRRQARDDFQAGKLDVIVCTAGSGGVGITLTASNTAVMMQRPWGLDLALQPEDRVHRIGAEIHDHVEIIDLVVKETIDEYRRRVLRKKAGQWAQLVRDRRVVAELFGGIR